MNFTTKVTSIGGILLLGLAVLSPANAQSVEAFYKGKTDLSDHRLRPRRFL